MSRRIERWLSVLGTIAVVFGLSKVHAAAIAEQGYSFTGSSRFSWALGFIALLTLTTYAMGLPDQPRTALQAAWAGALASGGAAIGISVAQLATGDALLPRFVVFSTAVITIPWQIGLNALARREQDRDELRDRVLLVAPPTERARLVDDLKMELERATSLAASLTPAEAAAADGHSPLLDAQARSGATVVVIDRSAMTDDSIVSQAAALHESGLRVRTLLGFYEEWLGKLPTSELERATLFFDIGELHRANYTRVKRVVDISLALLGAVALVAISPIILIGNIAANRGPLLFRQTRVGKDGKHFTILKFRTMTPGAPDECAPRQSGHGEWTTNEDPRVTGFGRLLRRSHLDELPQVVNILRGDLAVVGPRPEQPHYVDDLRGHLAFYDLRHLVRPGLTGWAQVKYGYAGDRRDAMEKLQYEFFYLRHQDLKFDARIVLRTFRSIAGGRGNGR